jgi:hypothetical protein
LASEALSLSIGHLAAISGGLAALAASLYLHRVLLANIEPEED